jgi:hypothetical protein
VRELNISTESPKFDRNVSPNWKPVARLEGRKRGMLWSDRIWHWLVSLGGLALIAVGVMKVPAPGQGGRVVDRCRPGGVRTWLAKTSRAKWISQQLNQAR